MTTSNGGRVVEHVSGVVQGANDRGVHLQGEPNWRNFSKYAESITPPSRGAQVRLGLDASGFVRELVVLEAAPTIVGIAPTGRDREIRRMTAIKIAANVIGQFAQTHEEVRTADIFLLADRVLAWIELEPEKGEDAL